MAQELKIRKKRAKFDWKRSINFFLGLLLIYFLFFGFIINTGNYNQQKDPGIKILYVYTAFFNTDKLTIYGIVWPNFIRFIFKTPCWASIFILFLIGILQSYREDFVVYAIKNNIWMAPIIIVISWILYSIAYFGHPLIAQAAALDIANIWRLFAIFGAYIATFFITLAQTIGTYFTSIHALINILVLLVVYGSASLVGSALKSFFYQRAHPIIDLSPEATTLPTMEVN